MRKALIVSTRSGFLPQFELNNVRLLKKNGFEIHYAANFDAPLYRYPEDLFENEQIICHHISIRKSPYRLSDNRNALRQLKRLAAEENFDLVHVHNPMGGVLGRLAAASSSHDPCVIYTSHGFHFYKGAPVVNNLLYKYVEKQLAKKTDVIITINQEDFENAQKFRLKPGGFVARVFGTGVDTELFAPRPEENTAVREELNIPQDAFHIVTAGELNKNKNHKTLIRALSLAGKKDVFLSICGKGEDEEALIEMIKELQLEDTVRLQGFRTDMYRVLQSADCFAFPSLREGLGLAAIEALLCGVPVIALDNRGSREYLIDRENGLVVRDNTPEAFKNAMELLYNDRSLTKALTGNARSSALKFSRENNEALMKEIYVKAMEKKTAVDPGVPDV